MRWAGPDGPGLDREGGGRGSSRNLWDHAKRVLSFPLPLNPPPRSNTAIVSERSSSPHLATLFSSDPFQAHCWIGKCLVDAVTPLPRGGKGSRTVPQIATARRWRIDDTVPKTRHPCAASGGSLREPSSRKIQFGSYPPASKQSGWRLVDAMDARGAPRRPWRRCPPSRLRSTGAWDAMCRTWFARHWRISSRAGGPHTASRCPPTGVPE